MLLAWCLAGVLLALSMYFWCRGIETLVTNFLRRRRQRFGLVCKNHECHFAQTARKHEAAAATREDRKPAAAVRRDGHRGNGNGKEREAPRHRHLDRKRQDNRSALQHDKDSPGSQERGGRREAEASGDRDSPPRQAYPATRERCREVIRQRDAPEFERSDRWEEAEVLDQEARTLATATGRTSDNAAWECGEDPFRGRETAHAPPDLYSWIKRLREIQRERKAERESRFGGHRLPLHDVELLASGSWTSKEMSSGLAKTFHYNEDGEAEVCPDWHAWLKRFKEIRTARLAQQAVDTLVKFRDARKVFHTGKRGAKGDLGARRIMRAPRLVSKRV